MNRKSQGNIGESFAIFFYTKQGFIVSKPLSENTPYDLVVDTGKQLLRVQVKTSNYQRYNDGRFQVQLRTSGGNQSGTGKFSYISSEEVDCVFVLCFDGNYYEVPVEFVENKNSITLSVDSKFHKGYTPL